MAHRDKHLLCLDGVSAGELIFLLDTASSSKETSGRNIKRVPTLRRKTVVSRSDEASIRGTSLEIAAKRMSAAFVSIASAREG